MKDATQRWEEGIPHDDRSLEIAKFIKKVDAECEYSFGGDGDNGETLLYYLDMFFEHKDMGNINLR